jgi:hypothetical protein
LRANQLYQSFVRPKPSLYLSSRPKTLVKHKRKREVFPERLNWEAIIQEVPGFIGALGEIRTPDPRIGRLRVSRFNAVLGNPETKLTDHSEFDAELAKHAAQTCISGNDVKDDIACLITLVSQSGFANRSGLGVVPFWQVLRGAVI